MLLGALHRRGLAGAQLAVNLQQGLLGVFGDILLDGGVDPLVVAEEVDQISASEPSPRARTKTVTGSLRFLSMRT